MTCGDTFLLYDDDSGGTPHLHIVISDPNPRGEVVLVSVTTFRAKSDTMVCLNAGDHESISHPSVITYAYSKLLTVQRVEQLVIAGDAIPKSKASQELVLRAQKGMMETDRAPREISTFFRDLNRQ